MRIYRSNPFNSVGRLPPAGGAMVVAFLAVLVLGTLGIWSELTIAERHGAQVRQALAAQGFGPTTVEPVRKAGCGRARRLYRWEAAAAAGTACAGSGFPVTLRVEEG